MSATGTAAAGPDTVTPRRRLIGTIGIIFALALASIDVSVVSTAMPRIANELSGLHLYAWVGISYAVVSAVLIPIAGKLGDMFGRKPFLLAGLVGFMIASFLCGAAGTMMQLVIYRGLHGLFAGVLMASIYTVVADLFPAERRMQMQGVLFSVAGLSMVIGPLLGGVVTDQWHWRWVFYLNIPIGLIAAAAILIAVPYVRSQASLRDIDLLGALMLTAGLVPILIGLSLTGTGHQLASANVLLPIIAGLILLAVFIWVESRAGHPIVPLGIFRNRTFAVLTVIAFFSAYAMGGTVFFVPLMYQGVLGVSATHSGSLVIPLTLALMVVPPFAGKVLASVAKYRFVGTFAFAAMVGGLIMLTTVDPGTSGAIPVIAMLLIGVGIGIAFPMATSVAQNAVPMTQLGVATSQIQFWRILAGPMAYAILGSILSARLGGATQASLAGESTGVSPTELAAAMHTMFWVAAAMVAVGLIATLVLQEVPHRRPEKPAAAPAATRRPSLPATRRDRGARTI